MSTATGNCECELAVDIGQCAIGGIAFLNDIGTNGRFIIIKKNHTADCMLRRCGCCKEQTADEQIKAFFEIIH